MKLFDLQRSKLNEQMTILPKTDEFLDDVCGNNKWTLNQQTKRIDVSGNVFVRRYHREIPIPFGVINGNFSFETDGHIASFNNCPTHVLGTFTAFCMEQITSLEGITPHIEGTCDLRMLGTNSYHNIHKHIKYVGAMMYLGGDSETREGAYPTEILGLIFIDGLSSGVAISHVPPELTDLVNRHVTSPTRDVHAFQEDLIKAGYPKMARL